MIFFLPLLLPAKQHNTCTVTLKRRALPSVRKSQQNLLVCCVKKQRKKG